MIPLVRSMVVGAAVAVGSAIGHAEAQPEDMLGTWSGVGAGEITASIRRGRSNPEYLVAEITTVTRGCLGSVTVYGKLDPQLVQAESYDPADPQAPVCRIDLELVGRQALRITEKQGCLFYHGAACSFSGNLTRQ